MFAKGKPMQQPQQLLPIETQAKEKLTGYVYEFLVHIGAKNAANSLFNEARLEKPVPIGDAPGFLYSWWNVFWDLYCAATPERRDSIEPSNEAKMFHEYQGQDLMMNPSLPMMNYFNMPPGQGNPMMNPAQHQRFNSGGQRPIRMPMEFNPNGGMNPNAMGQDPNRVQPGMSPLSRLTPPGNRMQPGMQMQGNFNGAPNPNQMRGPPSQAPTPGLPNSQPMANGPMSPMSMSMQQPQQRWNPNNNQVGPPQQPGQSGQGLQPPPPPMNYPPGSSPLSYQNVQMGGHHGGPGTPNLMPSPQDANNDFNNLMKNVPNQFQDQNMGHMIPMNQEMNMNNEMIDSIKHSPMQNIQVNRHPNEDHNVSNQMNDLNYSGFNDPSLFQ